MAVELNDEEHFTVDNSSYTAPEFPSAAYDRWKTTEPDDSDVVYYDTWEEAEARCAEVSKRFREHAAKQELVTK